MRYFIKRFSSENQYPNNDEIIELDRLKKRRKGLVAKAILAPTISAATGAVSNIPKGIINRGIEIYRDLGKSINSSPEIKSKFVSPEYVLGAMIRDPEGREVLKKSVVHKGAAKGAIKGAVRGAVLATPISAIFVTDLVKTNKKIKDLERKATNKYNENEDLPVKEI